MIKTSTVCYILLLALAVIVLMVCVLQKRESYDDPIDPHHTPFTPYVPDPQRIPFKPFVPGGRVMPTPIQPNWCPKKVSTPENIDPAFMDYCIQECQANQTVMPGLCSCACAQAMPYVA